MRGQFTDVKQHASPTLQVGQCLCIGIVQIGDIRSFVSGESGRERLLGNVEPVVVEHVVERLPEQRPHGVAGQWVPDQHDTVVFIH